MKWFICCGNDSQQTPSNDGKVSIVNLDNPPNRSVPAKDSPSDTAQLLATSNHPTHSGTKNNNTSSNFNSAELHEVNTRHPSNKASIV